MKSFIFNSDYIRGYIDVMILRVLWDSDSYRYEIFKKIHELSGSTYSMKETTLYSAFSRMEKAGYLNSYSDGRKRTYYTLTDKGRKYYRQKCTGWAQTKDLITKFIIIN